MVTRALITLALVIALTACGGSLYKSESNCPGYLENGQCLDLRQTYDATHHYDRERYRELLRAQQEDGNRRRGRSAKNEVSPEDGEARVIIGYAPLMQGEDHPRPILTQAIPVRVFVDPFEDEHGRLHTPGFIYARATEPEWIFGSKEATDARVVTPLVPQ